MARGRKDAKIKRKPASDPIPPPPGAVTAPGDDSPPAHPTPGPHGRPTPAQAAEQRRRAEAAALNDALAEKRCPNCTVVGNWIVYDRERSRGRVRYVKCRCCQHADQVAVVVKDGETP